MVGQLKKGILIVFAKIQKFSTVWGQSVFMDLMLLILSPVCMSLLCRLRSGVHNGGTFRGKFWKDLFFSTCE